MINPYSEQCHALVGKAFFFAKEAHRGQKDDCGYNYFASHIIPVANTVAMVTYKPELIASALLHDTVEDCGVEYNDISMQFGSTVANLVMEVTHDGKPDVKGHWFPRLKTRDGIMLKYADRLNNLSRMQSWNPERQEHYLRKSKFWKSSPHDSINMKNTKTLLTGDFNVLLNLARIGMKHCKDDTLWKKGKDFMSSLED